MNCEILSVSLICAVVLSSLFCVEDCEVISSLVTLKSACDEVSFEVVCISVSSIIRVIRVDVSDENCVAPPEVPSSFTAVVSVVDTELLSNPTRFGVVATDVF